jgi:hypothetical protein
MKLSMIVSVICNILLFAGMIALGIMWHMEEKILSDIYEFTKIKRHNAIRVTSIVERELQGFQKQDIVDVLDNIPQNHPDYIVSTKGDCVLANGIRIRCPGRAYSISPIEDCLYYGGLNFLFKEGRFVHFDKNLKCSFGIPGRGNLYNGET